MLNHNKNVKHKKYSVKFKEEAVNSVHAASNKYSMYRKSVQEWKKKSEELFHLQGAGRKIKLENLEAEVMQFF